MKLTFTILIAFLTCALAQCTCTPSCPPLAICNSGKCICGDTTNYLTAPSVTFPTYIFDFKSTNPDFEVENPPTVTPASTLGTDGIIVLTPPRVEWFHYTPNVNMNTTGQLTFTRSGGTLSLDNNMYFPIDNQLFGNEGKNHNYDFSTYFTGLLSYSGGEIFTLRYDDSIAIYINRYLAFANMGLNFNATATFTLESIASQCGITRGNVYDIRFFHMDRHVWFSMFSISTTAIIRPYTCQTQSPVTTNCNNGVYNVVTGLCQCITGWTGKACNVRLCVDESCGNGKCDATTNTCKCKGGWSGQGCNEKSCYYNGHYNNGVCQCYAFFSGSECDGCSGQLDNKHIIVCDNSTGDWKVGAYSHEDAKKQLKLNGRCAPGTNGVDCMCKPSRSEIGRADDQGSSSGSSGHSKRSLRQSNSQQSSDQLTQLQAIIDTYQKIVSPAYRLVPSIFSLLILITLY
jgi:fibro-slime domain-containing protein